MKNLAFVLWILLWPLICAIENYLQYLSGENYSNNVEFIASIIYLCIWVGVGKKLYVKVVSK